MESTNIALLNLEHTQHSRAESEIQGKSPKRDIYQHDEGGSHREFGRR
jgi:hypothetical protein